jgi:hypothetical protein
LGFYIGKTYAKDLIKDITRTLTSSPNEKDNWKLVDPIDLNKIVDYSVLKVEPKIKRLWIYNEIHKVTDGQIKLEYPPLKGGGMVVKKINNKSNYSVLSKEDYIVDEDYLTFSNDELEDIELLLDYEREFDGKETFYVKFKRPEPLVDPNIINLIFLINPVESVLNRKNSIINNIKEITRRLYESETIVNLGFAVNFNQQEDYIKLKFNEDLTTTNFEFFTEEVEALFENLQHGNSNTLYKTSKRVIDDYFSEDVTENHLVLLTGLESGGGGQDLNSLKNSINNKNKLHLVYPQCDMPTLTDICEAIPPLLEFEPSTYSIKIKINPSGNIEGTQYLLERSITGEKNWFIVSSWTTETEFVDDSKNPGTLYYYRVRARNPYNSTSTYNTKNVRTLLP